MNNITKLPSNPVHNLRFLEELRLAGNGLTYIPKGAFAGLFSLKVLMLQNNQLRQVPTEALQNLRSLQSLRLDANHINYVPPNCFNGLVSLRHLWLDDNSLTEIPVQAFRSLPALQAMTLALNKIHYIPDYAFGNLSSLVVLDLNYNSLDEFPTAIRTLTNLKELTLNGASQLTEFPDLTGTTSLESLDLSYNLLEDLPCFTACKKLQKMDLAWNKIKTIHPNAFSSLPSLIKLQRHLEPIAQDHIQTAFEYLQRVIEMPYAYQCCAFGACESHYRISSQWNKDDNSSLDDFHRKDAGLLQIQDERDFEDFFLDFEEDLKSHHSVQCSPSPGMKLPDRQEFKDSVSPFKPCDHLFGSWLIRVGVWTIVGLTFLCNALVSATVFRSPLYMSSIKLLIGLMAIVNAMMGLASGVLASCSKHMFGQQDIFWKSLYSPGYPVLLNLATQEAFSILFWRTWRAKDTKS
ncbi:Leucine-rich repeat-containing G-protein coupled receptor 5 [Lonchura striata]|uniref:Leucine-rich repeat-containing G-protein coupled receptor 5 n=1 Tax=Lonchura striata TaxID=40157 RepID=A0A218URP8_9PASE|nr:Leucine-rich repeat-containing G-protein coupled receptor 5 [Lonchura striata domestica]